MITLGQIDSADPSTPIPPPTSSAQTNTSSGDVSAHFSRKCMFCKVCRKAINPQSDTEAVDPQSDTKAIDPLSDTKAINPQSDTQKKKKKSDQRCFVSLSPDGVVDAFFHWKCLPLNPAAIYRKFHDVLSKYSFLFCAIINDLFQVTPAKGLTHQVFSLGPAHRAMV